MVWIWRLDTNPTRNWLGICNHAPRIIRINVLLHKEYRFPLLTTCLHEDLHRVFPKKREDEIEKLAHDAYNLLARLLMARYRRKLAI